MAQVNTRILDDLRRSPDVGCFNDDVWSDLLGRISTVFRLDGDRRTGLESNTVFRLVAALPYLAGCDEPARTALSHMATFLLAADDATRDVYAHGFRDSSDLQHRLEPISHFLGGDERLIRRGMRLLTLAMIADHVHDEQADRDDGKFNPVGAGHWDAEELMGRIRLELADIPCPEMDAILDPDQIPGYWDN